MNGRVYDPATAQFFSPDPFVQEAGNWQNYNRYSYVFNNPLIFTDPSGYRKKTFHELDMENLSDYTPVENTSYRYIKEASTSGGGNLFQRYVEVLKSGYSGDYSDFIYSYEHQSNKPGFNGYIRIPASTFNHGGFTPDYTTVWDHKFIVIWVGNRPIDNDAGGGASEVDKYGTLNAYVVTLTGTAAFGGGGTFEFGYVTTTKNYAQYYLTLQATAGIAVTINTGVGVIRPNKGQNPTFSDWAGRINSISGSYICTADAEDYSWSKQLDDFQATMDAAGVVDPTPICDGISGIISLFRGQWKNAGISALGCISYAGDLAKGEKYGAKVLKYLKLADKSHTTAATFNNTSVINAKIMFNDISQGFSKEIIQTPKGNILRTNLGDGNFIQMRAFDKSGSHTTFDFINNNGLYFEFKFNY